MGNGNKVQFGFSNVHFALEAEDSTEEFPKWETPIKMPGAVTFEPENVGDEYVFYADNIAYYMTHSDNGYTGDLTMALFPENFLVPILGWEVDGNDGLLEVQNGEKRRFALLGQVEGDKHGRRFAFYGCMGSKPTNSYQTNEENIEVQTQTMPISIRPIDVGNGKYASKYSVPRTGNGQAIYDAFFAQVYIPGRTIITP